MDALKAEIANKRKALEIPAVDGRPTKYIRRGDLERLKEEQERAEAERLERERQEREEEERRLAEIEKQEELKRKKREAKQAKIERQKREGTYMTKAQKAKAAKAQAALEAMQQAGLVAAPTSETKKPVYSNDGKTITIKLNPYKWSNGESVTAQNVLFNVGRGVGGFAPWVWPTPMRYWV